MCRQLLLVSRQNTNRTATTVSLNTRQFLLPTLSPLETVLSTTWAGRIVTVSVFWLKMRPRWEPGVLSFLKQVCAHGCYNYCVCILAKRILSRETMLLSSDAARTWPYDTYCIIFTSFTTFQRLSHCIRLLPRECPCMEEITTCLNIFKHDWQYYWYSLLSVVI